MIDTQLLNQKLKESGIRKDFLASILKVSKQSLSNKINNRNDFKPAESITIKQMLKLNDSEFCRIFFAEEWENNSQSEKSFQTT